MMTGTKTSFWICTACVAVLLPSCKKKAPPVVPPAAPPAVILPKPSPVKKPKPTSLPPGPKIETPPVGEPPFNVEVKPETTNIPPLPVPQKKRRNAARKTEPKSAQEVKTAEVKPEAVAETPPAGAAPLQLSGPKLVQILSPEEARDYVRRLDGALERIKSGLAVIQGKALNQGQKEEADRIKSFVAQAEQARDQDLVSAVSLAERADLLSRDLLERLR
ncbi:MAG TPA: hypothetical protein VMZ52_15435 [Bryobacteraceae bacterium]|nr:hypothetical protein [Bryobacteraceae bacterium]